MRLALYILFLPSSSSEAAAQEDSSQDSYQYLRPAPCSSLHDLVTGYQLPYKATSTTLLPPISTIPPSYHNNPHTTYIPHQSPILHIYHLHLPVHPPHLTRQNVHETIQLQAPLRLPVRRHQRHRRSRANRQRRPRRLPSQGRCRSAQVYGRSRRCCVWCDCRTETCESYIPTPSLFLILLLSHLSATIAVFAPWELSWRCCFVLHLPPFVLAEALR